MQSKTMLCKSRQVQITDKLLIPVSAEYYSLRWNYKQSVVIHKDISKQCHNCYKSEYKFKLQVCGKLTSQNEDQTQAPISSGTDNDEVIKHISNLLRVALIRRCSSKGCDHMYK
jgi:23S rRNA maturation-related 3'-5' exoribonuclease YhaM